MNSGQRVYIVLYLILVGTMTQVADHQTKLQTDETPKSDEHASCWLSFLRIK